jgi:hypothetical protein
MQDEESPFKVGQHEFVHQGRLRAGCAALKGDLDFRDQSRNEKLVGRANEYRRAEEQDERTIRRGATSFTIKMQSSGEAYRELGYMHNLRDDFDWHRKYKSRTRDANGAAIEYRNLWGSPKSRMGKEYERPHQQSGLRTTKGLRDIRRNYVS